MCEDKMCSCGEGEDSDSCGSCGGGCSSCHQPQDFKSLALFYAVVADMPKTVRAAVKEGANVDHHEFGAPLLMHAIAHGLFNMAKVLVSLGADVKAVSDNGWSALMVAAYVGDTVLVKMLLSRGAEKHAVNEDGDTAFSIAEKEGHTHKFLALLK